MELQVGPIRLILAPATPRLHRAAESVAARWPVQADTASIPARVTTRIRLYEQAGRLPRVRAEVQSGDPAAGSWRMGQDPLWVAQGEGLALVTVRLIAEPDPIAPAYGLRQFLRAFLTEATLVLGGLPLHAASAARDGRAYVFLAPSGGGKTTLARRYAEDGLLSDDTAFVVPGPHGPWVVPSPFPGREGLAASGAAAPLARLVDLVKGVPAEVRPLPRADGVARLVLRAKVPGHRLAIRERVLDAAIHLATVPGVLRMGLPPDRSPWSLLGVP